MARNYWERILNSRLTRRRSLRLVGGTVAGSAFLAACGGDDDGGGGSGSSNGSANGGGSGSSGLITPPVDTRDQAVQGGVAVYRANNAPPSFDPAGGGGQVTVRVASDYTYPQLLSFDFGTAEDPPTGKVVGEGMESWEVASDGLSVILKLRPQKFDPRPPTNGREANTDDVKWSMERYAELHSARSGLFNSLHPDAPVQSIEYPDANTMVISLAFPTPYILATLGTTLFAPYLMPVEADGGFDIKNETRGSGPFMLTEFASDIHRKYERNPNYWDAPQRPYLDGVDYILIPETATWLSQFQAGNIWRYDPLNAEAVSLKNEMPDVNLSEVYNVGAPGSENTQYYLPSTLPGSVFQDVRVRRAMSMLLDRDVALDAAFNIAELEAEGVRMQSAWHGTASALWADQYLDPKADELGEGSKYFHHNPDEAAKLLRAADAFGTEANYTTYTSQYSGVGQLQTDVLNQMLQEGGHFKLNMNVIDLTSEFFPNYHFAKGQFEGIMYLTYGSYPDFGLFMWNAWMPSGRNAVSPEIISPTLDELARKHRSEFDPQARIPIQEDWQKEMALEMPTIPWPGIATEFMLTHPWLSNGGNFRYWGYPRQEADTYIYWYDESKT